MLNLANRYINERVRADVAIVGSGAAGLSMAAKLDDAGIKTVVLETGGLEHEPQLDGLSRGPWTGDIGVGVGSRRRFFGGSTNCWGGHTAPMDPIGYEQRPWVPNSGWPISPTELDPYVPAAQALIRVGFESYDVKEWAERLLRVADGLLLEDSAVVETKLFQRSRVARFGELLRRQLDESNNTTVVLGGHVVELETSLGRDHVTSLRVATPGIDGVSQFWVDASIVVLAAGIENSRLLLTSDADHGGVGNRHDQVGRYFMGHFNFVSGRIEPSAELDDPSLYTIPGDVLRYVEGSKAVVGALRLAPEVQEERQILDVAAFLLPFRPHDHWMGRSRAAAVARSAARLNRDARWSDLREGSVELPRLARFAVGEGIRRATGRRWYGIRSWAEQAPHPDNRVTINRTRDRFGMPRLQVQSNLTALDKRTLHTGVDILAAEFKRAGLGRVVNELPTSQRWPRGAAGTSHFMGGTRMHDDPMHGVVDRNCRVHGVDNLYVAGGSVFPTSGLCMATYQLVLLSLRLADHVLTDVMDASDSTSRVRI